MVAEQPLESNALKEIATGNWRGLLRRRDAVQKIAEPARCSSGGACRTRPAPLFRRAE